MMKWARRCLRWGPPVLWMLLIFVMSHQPGGELNSYLPLFQRWFPWMKDFNWGHLVAYFVLALCFYWSFGVRGAGLKGRAAAVALSVLYGALDEWHQMYVPDRTADWMDLRNDAIGAVAAMCLVSLPPVQAWYRKLLRLQQIRSS